MPSHMAPFHYIWPPSIIIYGPVKIKSKSKGNGRDAITYDPLPSHMAPFNHHI